MRRNSNRTEELEVDLEQVQQPIPFQLGLIPQPPGDKLTDFRCANAQPFLCNEMGPFQVNLGNFQAIFRQLEAPFQAILGNFQAISGNFRQF